MRTMVAIACLVAAGSVASAAEVPTFSRDVAPILQQNCQGCHRAGEAGPMPLLSYRESRPYAAAIKEAVALRKMPPWFADPHYGKFSNDRSLAQRDIDTLVAWANAGAPEGDPNDMPPPRHFLEGWNIAQPDVVLEMPSAFNVPATGTINYQYILIPLNFKEDTWVQMAEVRPGDRAVMHHVIAYVRPPGSKWLPDIQPGIPYVPKDHPGEKTKRDASFLVGYAPGMPANILPDGRAKLIRAGSDIIFEMHYTTNGKATSDRSKIGLRFAKAPVQEQVVTLYAANGEFAIPPGDPNYLVESEFEFGADAKLVNLLPHMHLRGKDFEFKALYPTGESQVLLDVPHYSFSWQSVYNPVNDIVMPKGTRIHCTAHFDNSSNNPYNPDPGKEIKWGEQSWDEMMIGFFDVAIPRDMKVRDLIVPKKPPPPTTASNSPAKASS
jgi:hypothetical protein